MFTTLSMIDPDFTQAVRNALAHLYDYAYLQNHPLALRLTNGKSDAVVRAQQLRRTLLDCIEALRPHDPSGSPARPDDARAYAVLAYRCVDGLTMPEIEAKLALSRRQAYREYSKGVDAVAGQLWEQLQRLPAAEDNAAQSGPQQRLAVAQAEVERLRKDVRAEPLALAEVLENVIKLLTPRLHRTGTVIQCALLENCPPVVADRTMLRQALINILSHALDTIPGQGTLRLTAQPGQGHVQIVIREANTDDGAMRPQSQVKRAGVGLAVAANLLEAQGGHLTVDPVAGCWQAILSLPLAGEVTILAVDDNENLVALFQRYLAGHRITVLGANTGSAALAAAQQHNPRLIMLDVMMPQQDGWDILEQLQANAATKPIPVVICSVLNEAELALAMGASDYLTKPVNQQELLTVLQRWLGRLHPAA